MEFEISYRYYWRLNDKLRCMSGIAIKEAWTKEEAQMKVLRDKLASKDRNNLLIVYENVKQIGKLRVE
jgi:hypothetical protein